jgi:hypothetical protein
MAGLLFLNFVLQDLRLDLEIGELLPETLGLNAQLLSLLLANLNLLLH